MTREQIKALLPQASEDTIRKTLAYYAHQPVDRLPNPQPEPDPLRALVKKPEAHPGSKSRLPRFLVTITSHRPRKLDSDNLIAGAKPLRDCAAATCGVDDGDEDRITFEYAQVVTKGRPGTHLTITTY